MTAVSCVWRRMVDFSEKIKQRKIAEENKNKIKTKKKVGFSTKCNTRQIELSWAICEWTAQNNAK